MAERIGLVGLGIMGSAYAKHLAAAGLEVVAYDIDPARYAVLGNVPLTRAASPADVASEVDRIITSLPNARAFAKVMDEFAGTGRPLVVADTCTLTVAQKEAGRAALAATGSTLLDCPVGGTGAQAARGDLVIFGSGDEAAFARIRPAFEKMARVVHYLGSFGAGSVMKFTHNLLVAIHNCSAAEAFTLGIKAGMDPQVVYDVIRSSAGTSRMFEVRGPMMVSGDFESNISSSLETILKDIACISEHARDAECPTPLFSLAGDIHMAAAAQGYLMSDPAVVCRVIGRLAGIERG